MGYARDCEEAALEMLQRLLKISKEDAEELLLRLDMHFGCKFVRDSDD